LISKDILTKNFFVEFSDFCFQSAADVRNEQLLAFPRAPPLVGRIPFQELGRRQGFAFRLMAVLLCVPSESMGFGTVAVGYPG
jgi:hypothetical protein